MSINLPSRQLVSQADSANIENAAVPRSKFTGSWSRKTSFDAGKLYPILIEEVLPGDHLSYKLTAYVRMSTPLFPIFDNQRVDTHFFFVPCRLVWENWVKFMGEQTNPGDDYLTFAIPKLETSDPNTLFAVGSLYDHFGIPTTGQWSATPDTVKINALPLRAYNLIWNTWFRDQNLQNSLPVPTDNGPDATTNYNVEHRAKSHDYFTSCLPWPQKTAAAHAPVSGTALITGIGKGNGEFGQGPASVIDFASGATSYGIAAAIGSTTNTSFYVKGTATSGGLPAVYADLGSALGVNINQLRTAFALQAFAELSARGGTRYVEKIRAVFGVTNPDFRVQRPEYIGGGQTPLTITPVAQTAPAEGTTVGALGAAANAAGSHSASYAATEHGYIIGLMSVRTELSYQQGLNKLWSRHTTHDLYWPQFAGLGEQAVLRKELYATGVAAEDNLTFGFQERYQEYRTRQSEVTGIMRSTAAGTLDNWHLAQKFDPAPTLNQTFVIDTPPMDRVLAAGELAAGQQYLGDLFFTRTAVRPIPTYGTPSTLGRF